MANPIPESIAWLDKLAVLDKELAKKPTPKNVELAKALKVSGPMVTYYLAIRGIFDPTAREKIRRAAQGNHPFKLSYKSALALAGLDGKVPDLPKAVHEALGLILSRRLETRHIKALVEHMAGGKPAKDFDPTQVKRRPAGKAKTGTTEAKTEGEPDFEDEEGGEEAAGEGPSGDKAKKAKTPLTLGQRLDAALMAFSGGKQGKKLGKTATKEAKKTGYWFSHLFWHWTLKWVHTVAKNAAKVLVPVHSGSSGKPLATTVLHAAAYLFCLYLQVWLVGEFLASFLAPALRPWVEFPFRYLDYLLFIELPAWCLALALQHWLPALVLGALCLWGLGMAFKAQPGRMILLVLLFGMGWYYGRAWGSKELPSASSHSELAQPQRGPQLVASGQVKDTNPPTTAATPAKPVTAAPAKKPGPKRVLSLEEQMKALGMPVELNPRTKKAGDDVAQFAVSFYGISYHGLRDWADDMDNFLSTDYRHEFYKEYYSDDWRKELDSQKEYETFEPSRPPKLLSWDDTSDDWQVEGTVTLRSDLAYDGKLISKEHKVLTLSMVHFRDGSEAVYMVKESGK